MQQTFDSDPRVTPYHVAVVTVSLAGQTGSTFPGVATVQAPGDGARTIAKTTLLRDVVTRARAHATDKDLFPHDPTAAR